MTLETQAFQVRLQTLSGLNDYIGRECGISQWITIDQTRINAFAEATEDRQWIHLDPDRAARESPFKTTVAHGFLIVSLAPMLFEQMLKIEEVRFMVNRGFDQLRLREPVPCGSRIRMRGTLRDLRPLRNESKRAVFHIIFEIEGISRPAAQGDFVVLYYARERKSPTNLRK